MHLACIVNSVKKHGMQIGELDTNGLLLFMEIMVENVNNSVMRTPWMSCKTRSISQFIKFEISSVSWCTLIYAHWPCVFMFTICFTSGKTHTHKSPYLIGMQSKWIHNESVVHMCRDSLGNFLVCSLLACEYAPLPPYPFVLFYFLRIGLDRWIGCMVFVCETLNSSVTAGKTERLILRAQLQLNMHLCSVC